MPILIGSREKRTQLYEQAKKPNKLTSPHKHGVQKCEQKKIEIIDYGLKRNIF
jgi:hypothetical protein